MITKIPIQGMLVFANMHDSGVRWAIRRKDSGLQAFAMDVKIPKVDRNGKNVEAGALVDVVSKFVALRVSQVVWIQVMDTSFNLLNYAIGIHLGKSVASAATTYADSFEVAH